MLLLPASALPRCRSACPQGATRAFTLIELLMVIALIGILAAITMGILRGVKERAAIGQARTELAVLATALESYKRQYGDYPQTDDPAKLLQALIGRLGPTLKGITGKSFVDVAKFAPYDPIEGVSYTDKDPASNTGIYLADPWEQPYRYFYYERELPSGSSKQRGYVLYSGGPDTKHAPPVPAGEYAGEIDESATSNADNIYANR